MRLAHDSGSSDIFLHSTVDTAYAEACAAQTRRNICFREYDNTSSRAYKEIGPGKFWPAMVEDPGRSYLTDTLQIPGATIRSQVMGSTWFRPISVGIFGTSFPAIQSGWFKGRFLRYPSFIEIMFPEWVIPGQAESIWLDPSRSDPDDFPDDKVLYGAVDRPLFRGKLVTVPAVVPKNTTVAQDPTNWNLAVGAITRAAELRSTSSKSIGNILHCGYRHRLLRPAKRNLH